MADTENTSIEQENTNPDNKAVDEKADIQELVAKKVEESLKDIKSKLDKAYAVRDEALKKIADIEQARKEAELKRLQEEGKHKEALELQLAEAQAARAAVEKRNTELTRDLSLRNVLAGLNFRNENAQEMAYREIVNDLVQDQNGNWVHKSGSNIKDFVKSFASEESNSFLFKTKPSSGNGGGTVTPTDTSSLSGKSIFEVSQQDVMKLVREGKLTRRR